MAGSHAMGVMTFYHDDLTLIMATAKTYKIYLKQPQQTAQAITQAKANPGVKLPKYTIPIFSGGAQGPLQWQTFWDAFDVSVNKNT